MIASFFYYIFGYNKQNNHSNENKNTTHDINDNNNASDKYKIIDFSKNNIHERQPEPMIGPTCQNMFSDIYHDSKQQLPSHNNYTREKPIAINDTTVDIEHKADIPDTPESISTLSSDSSFTISDVNYDTLPDPPEDHSSQPKKNTSSTKIPHLNLKIIIPEPLSYQCNDCELVHAQPIQRCSSSEKTL